MPDPNEDLTSYEQEMLDRIDRDIDENPECLVPLSEAMLQKIAELTEGVEVDLDAPIEGDVDL